MNAQSKLMGRKPPNSAAHGGGVRGATLPRRSSQFEGAFGRMFRTLPAAEHKVKALEALAGDGVMLGRVMSAPETIQGLPSAAAENPATKLHDGEENSLIDAGYTYLGQFIDHDITFDPASSLQKQNDPDGLVDFRTPRLDLDCLYGRGPDDQPYMFTGDGKSFLLGDAIFEGHVTCQARDLSRHAVYENADGSGVVRQRALIGDKRNDENTIVSQLQSAMMQFHNRLVKDKGMTFEEAQRQTRWHYQYVVLNDFLPTIVGKEMLYSILPHLDPTSSGDIFLDAPDLRFYQPEKDAYIPVEFSVAAYRFGHSMVRPIYRLSKGLNVWGQNTGVEPTEAKRGLSGRLFIFAGIHERGLNGFDKIPHDRAIDWSLFFDINGSRNNVGHARVQPSYKIDPSMVNPLAFLPEFSTVNATPPLTVPSLQATPIAGMIANLAERNLKRGLFMSLPSGQTVARAMGIVPLRDDELFVGKATYSDAFGNDPRNVALTEICSSFAGNAPLWYYVLAEPLAAWMKEVRDNGATGDSADAIGTRMGPVGGRIVAETLIGLLLNDSQSYLRQDPNWTPELPKEHDLLRFRAADMIKYALRLDGSAPTANAPAAVPAVKLSA